ncbi:MAG: PH domain-containing protein [Alphaproteobacteria bacterium]|nr:PH domain-containing protein [Alphaproteobacteria bacterium]
MTSYVQTNLLKDEKVQFQSKVHWFVYVPAAGMLVLGLFMDFGVSSYTSVPLFTLIGLALLVKAWIQVYCTEIAVTDKRVMTKAGLIRRRTMELNHSKWESISVDQSILGRIFDFGTLVINGTGGGKEVVAFVDNPLEFRRNALEASDAADNPATNA